MSRMALHDRLTGLPNRTLLFDRLARALSKARQHGHQVGLLFLDLDGFKAVNDQFGHEEGDRVLKLVSARLIKAVAPKHTVARLGGDEFAVVLIEMDASKDAERCAESILAATAEPIVSPSGTSHQLGVSIGISLFPDNGQEIDVLLTHADQAMYESKIRGKNRYTFFKSAATPIDLAPWIKFEAADHVGFDEIDNQHGELIRLANKLNAAFRQGASAEMLARLFDELVLYTQFHFLTEERLMETYDYPDQAAHKKVHANLVEEIGHIKVRMSQGGELMALQTIKDWLTGHIEHSVRRWARISARRPAKLPGHYPRGLFFDKGAFDHIVAGFADPWRDLEAAPVEQLAAVFQHGRVAADHHAVAQRIQIG